MCMHIYIYIYIYIHTHIHITVVIHELLLSELGYLTLAEFGPALRARRGGRGPPGPQICTSEGTG